MQIWMKFLLCICLICMTQSAQAAKNNKGVVVLTYHHIDDNENGASISVRHFTEHMKMLKDNGYSVITMNQFQMYLEGRLKLPPRSVVITFDDGYESNYTKAYPIMKQYGFVGTVFIVVSSTEEPNTKNIPHLSWEQLLELQRTGWTIGSHTYNLHYTISGKSALTTLKENETFSQYRARVKNDLQYSVDLLEKRLNVHHNILAFPYGSFNETVLNVGREVGIEYFFSTREGSNFPGQKIIHRINAGSPGIGAEMILQKIRQYQY